MTRSAPLRIGISARLLHEPPPELGFRGKTLQYLEQSVAHWLLAHGALAFMVPTLNSRGSVGRAAVSLRDYVRELDGLVLQGGADVSPETYGESPLAPEWAGDRVRDLYEIELFWAFAFQGKPVLGICRGAQLINVALGGTLWQDIRTQIGGQVSHADSAAYDQHAHEIEIAPGSGLARLYGLERRRQVSSIHHQCVKTLGRGLVVEAVSPEDGVIEAIRWRGASYAVGLQWHPEFHRAGNLLDSAPVLEEFLREASRARRPSANAAGAKT